MTQTILTIPFEVQPASAAPLEALITRFRHNEERSATPYERLIALPTLHFISVMVFTDPQYDPLLLIEVNFDGPRSAFWQAFVSAIGPELLDMFRYCAVPRDHARADAFKAMLAQNGAGMAGVLEATATFPTASHLGNRGLTRDRIEAEDLLFQAVQAELHADDSRYRALPPIGIHAKLRTAVLASHAWLDEPGPLRITSAENLADWRNAVVFVCLLATVLAIPGMLLAALLPPVIAAALAALAAVFVWSRIPDFHAGVARIALSTASLIGVAVLALLALALALALCLAILSFALWLLNDLVALAAGRVLPSAHAWARATFATGLAGLVGMPAVLLGLVWWLRRVESGDSTNSEAVPDPVIIRQMREREDFPNHIVQNHMGSIVLVKPGVLRTVALSAGHRALHLMLRITNRDGYLSDMRTVHFAHWALLNNGSRLLFMSNFDGTWDSYLDDFIEKAHAGTTLAWTNSVGSPPTRFLVLDGVQKGRQFKDWARRSMAPNLFWYSAYPKLTVNQIERNHRVAEGLRRPSLDTAAATAWTKSL